MKINKVTVILGPTSSGKTTLGLKLCKQHNGEIISADSRQVYKYMDIGTGKVPVKSDIKIEKFADYWVLDAIKVWGYDLVTPAQFYSGYDFASFALNKAKEIIEQGKNVFIVGGTGFYIDLITGNVKPSNIEPDFELRKELEQHSLEDLQKDLMSLNPQVYASTDINNKVRLIRAIEREIGKKTNNTLPYLSNVEFTYIGLKAEKELLYARADAWLDEIWANGLLDEVKELKKLGFGESDKLKGLVYKSADAYLNGIMDEKSAVQRAKFDLHAYIRRQLTYFNKNTNIKWFDIADSIPYNLVSYE